MNISYGTLIRELIINGWEVEGGLLCVSVGGGWRNTHPGSPLGLVSLLQRRWESWNTWLGLQKEGEMVVERGAA